MKCQIRKWKIEDASELAYTINDLDVQNNLTDGIPYPYTVEDGKEYIKEMLSSSPENVLAYAIIVDNHVVGSTSVKRMDNIYRRTAEIGYYIVKDYWGNSITCEAVKQICQYVFEHTDIVRIFAAPFVFNYASCRVLEKSGFQFEGVLRNNGYKNGKIYDMRMYSLIKEN